MKFDHDLSVPKVPFREAKRERADLTQNVIIPFALALGSGFVTFVAIGAIAIGWKLPVKWPLVIAGFVTLIVLALGLVLLVHQRLLITTETIKGPEIKQGDWIGPPQITAFELPRGNHSLRFGEIEVEPQLLMDWCQAAAGQRSLAYGVWERRFALPDGSQGRERYQAFRDWLVANEFAEEVGGNIGLRIRWNNQDATNWVNGFAQLTPGDGVPLLE